MLVAGGLGERLGYSGIKIALPTDLARGACFLQVLPSPVGSAALAFIRLRVRKILRLIVDSVCSLLRVVQAPWLPCSSIPFRDPPHIICTQYCLAHAQVSEFSILCHVPKTEQDEVSADGWWQQDRL